MIDEQLIYMTDEQLIYITDEQLTRWRWWLVDRIGRAVEYDSTVDISLLRGKGMSTRGFTFASAYWQEGGANREAKGFARGKGTGWPGWPLYLAGLRLVESLRKP